MEHDHSTSNHKHADYALHIPKSLTYPVPVSVVSVLLGILFFTLFRERQPLGIILAGISLFVGAIYLGVHILLKRLTDLDRRLEERKKFLDQISWNGNETFLDVGCGNGILTMGAAKRLTTRCAVRKYIVQ